MTPNMTVNEMLDSFIFVVKGSRVIDRKATDWGNAYWMGEKYVRHLVYSMTDLKRYFASPYRSKYRDYPFDQWLTHPHRLMAPTLSDAMKLADSAARGLIGSRIDLKAIEKNAIMRQNPTPWDRAASAA